jgi:uncharacterized protein YecT (DUF1311 family)
MVLAVVAAQIGLAYPACAEGSADSGRPISDALPLYGTNHCGVLKGQAERLFCGDPELNAISAKLNAAIQDRLNRLANRRLAIEENAEWIKDRDSSCGIPHNQAISYQDVGLPVDRDAGKNRNPERSEFRLSGGEHHRRHADMQRSIAGAGQDRAQ